MVVPSSSLLDGLGRVCRVKIKAWSLWQAGLLPRDLLVAVGNSSGAVAASSFRAARTSASGAIAIRARKRREVLVPRLQGRLYCVRPAKPLKLRRDLGVIHVRIIAAAR